MPFVAILFLIIVVVILPFLSLYNFNVIDHIKIALPPKKKIYIQSAQNQLVLMALGLWAVSSCKLSFSYGGDFSRNALIGAGIFLVVGLGLSALSSRSKYFRENNPGLDLLKPETADEKITWVLVNAVAATCEEIIFRGALFVIFYSTTHNMIVAGTMSAVCFGFSHSIQGPAAILITMLFGGALQYLAWLNNGLLLPMIVHFIYNLGVTLIVSREDAAATTHENMQDPANDDHY